MALENWDEVWRGVPPNTIIEAADIKLRAERFQVGRPWILHEDSADEPLYIGFDGPDGAVAVALTGATVHTLMSHLAAALTMDVSPTLLLVSNPPEDEDHQGDDGENQGDNL